MTGIQGRVAGGFDAVRDAFAANFAERAEVGAAVAVYASGEPVVDLWAGEARPGVAWDEDTVASVFSTTKGPAALVVQLLADCGVLDVDAPIASYWPEFAANGKDAITLADVLSHRSGVITFPDYYEVELHDTEEIVRRISDTAPMWAPGERHGYHALTMGWISAEAVRRATGRTLGTVFREDIAELLDLDFWIGLPAEHHDRAADLIDAPPPDDPGVAAYLALFNPATWTGQAHFVSDRGLLGVADTFNSPEVRTAEVPAGGGMGTARSLAKLYGTLARGGRLNGVSLVSPDSIARFTKERVGGPDAVLILETRFGLGYARPTELLPMGPNDEAYGHAGLGGSLAFADPVTGVGFGYVPNQLQFPRLDGITRAQALIDAVYSCL